MVNLEKPYEKAVADPSFRQEFVDMIDISYFKDYVSKVIIKPKQKDPNLIMRCRPLFSMGTKSTIFVYPLAFDKEIHPNVYDFISTLEDHECYHAVEDYFYGHILPKDTKEINANINVLNNITEKNSKEYITFIKKILKSYQDS